MQTLPARYNYTTRFEKIACSKIQKNANHFRRSYLNRDKNLFNMFPVLMKVNVAVLAMLLPEEMYNDGRFEHNWP